MSKNENSNNYDQKNISTMEMIYGEGYLSAGGNAEIDKIFAGVDIAGKRILDLGCGLGGALVTLAKDHNAAFVRGADTNKDVLVRAKQLIKKHKLEDKTKLTLIEPGALPFQDNSFDIVHITAVACHIESLVPFLSEILRVLKPSGQLVGRDWFKVSEEDADEYTKWHKMLRDKGLNFYFVGEWIFINALQESGFDDIRMTDRTSDIVLLAQDELTQVTGPLKTKLTDALGDEGYGECVDWTYIRYQALRNGGIGQSQFKATKA